MLSLWNALTRKKRNDTSEDSKLARVLNLFDLTALGVGSTLGLGVYVLAGSVAYEQAGPAVTISFLIAAIASAFAGLCYAEFAARVPKAGSAYVYSYVSVGEFVAFTIGWNLILEYVIGASSVARGISTYIDALIDYKMRDFWRGIIPVDVSFLAEYPDILSFSIVMVLSIILALGVKESSWVHSTFTIINIFTIFVVIVAGGINADPKNLFLKKDEIPDGINAGEGGFVPYGIAGIVSGAATCFYGFIGFDCVATAGEEAKNAKRSIPLAIILTLVICVAIYMAISIVLTMLTPYYLLDPNAPFPSAFQKFEYTSVKWIISIGALFALFSCLLGALFSLPRVLYAMSSDGILFKSLSEVNSKTKTPITSTLLSGVFSGVLAAIFSLQQLVDMLSIGTLLAYTIVSLCVMILRYENDMLIPLWNALTRKKRNDTSEDSKLARVLNLFDLTALGVGSTLGLGVYVLAGSVAYEQAGPAVTISFLIAAIASAFAGLCYAEFAARVPKAGSAYVYSYVSVGEFVAFTIGWNLILEYVIGTSSVARGLSGYLDSLFDNRMGKFFREIMPIDVDFLAEYPDFFSFTIVMILAIILAAGVKESTFLNNIFTGVNLLTVIIVLVAGSINANPKNWVIPKEDIPEGVRGGEGGFMPFGLAGIMAGAAKCFYGFVGFDCVATTGEEAKNPKRNIPLAIVISLIIIFLAYFGISTVLTMMIPYYLQDPDAPFPHAFDAIEWYTVKWIVSIGAIFALCTSLLGAMFPLPRVLYAMGNDGILYKFMKRVHPKTRTPLIATILSGLLAAIMATIFNLHQLIDMMSIGTLLAYTIVAICVLVLHYEAPACELQQQQPSAFSMNSFIQQLINYKFTHSPSSLSADVAKIGICVFCVLATTLCALLKLDLTGTVIFAMLVVVAGILVTIIVIARQPKDKSVDLSFEVPFVPILPCLSIFINLYLMFQLDGPTWIRFGVWVLIGYLIYFTYGIRKSTEGRLSSAENLQQQQHPGVTTVKIETISGQLKSNGVSNYKEVYAE